MVRSGHNENHHCLMPIPDRRKVTRNKPKLESERTGKLGIHVRRNVVGTIESMYNSKSGENNKRDREIVEESGSLKYLENLLTSKSQNPIKEAQ